MRLFINRLNLCEVFDPYGFKTTRRYPIRFNIRDKILTSVYISRNESSCSENEEKSGGTGNEKSADDKSNMADDVNPEKKSRNQIVLSNRHKSLGIIRIRSNLEKVKGVL